MLILLTLIPFGVCVQSHQQPFRDQLNPIPDMAESRFACTLRVNEVEGVQKLIEAAGKATQPAGGSVNVSESVILEGGGYIACRHWIEPYRLAQFFLHSSWRPGPAIRPQHTDESLLLREEPWLFLNTESRSKSVPVQLAELSLTALPSSPRWFRRVEPQQGLIVIFCLQGFAFRKRYIFSLI